MVSSSLEKRNVRSVCFGCDKRLSICFVPSAKSTTIVTGKTGINLPRNSSFVSHTGNRDNSVSPVRIRFQHFPGSQEEWKNETSYKFKTTKSICTEKVHFKMVMLESAIRLIRKGNYLATLDLKEAYYLRW